MEENRKKIIIAIGGLLGAIIMALLLYFVFFREAPLPAPEPIPEPAPTKPKAGFKPAQDGGPIPLVPGEPVPPEIPLATTPTVKKVEPNVVVEKPVSAPTISGDGRAVNFYDSDAGKFYRLTSQGPIELSSQTFPSVKNVSWSPINNQAIMEFPDGANILYNFDRQEQVSLPQHWQEFKFSPAGDRIAFKSLGTDFDNRWLAISSPDGSEVQALEPLGNNDRKLIVNWSPNNQMVGMFTENLSSDRSELFFIGLHDENFKSTTLEGLGFVGQWMPDGDRILYSVYSNNTNNIPTLWMVDASGNDIGNNKRPIGLATWADKCVAAKDKVTVFCAAPIDPPAGAGIFRPAVADLPDNFYRVNTLTGSYELIAAPTEATTAEKLILSEDGRTLFFQNKKTNFLQKIEL